ncbi:MAG: type II toxin-antitoxin system VapC family toxin [Kiritimatiellia bacterium]
MKILLDTHALIWWLEDNPKLGKLARKYISNPSNEVWVSAVSSWEISLKKSKGALKFPDGVGEVLAAEGFEFLPISLAETVETVSMPPLHQDPFDRLLIAQALLYGLKLFTADKKILAYPVSHFDCRK